MKVSTAVQSHERSSKQEHEQEFKHVAEAWSLTNSNHFCKISGPQ